MEAVELILHELRPKWKNKIAEVTWGLRRLHVKSQKAVSRSDPLQGSDKNVGQAKLVCWIASTMGPKGMQHGHGEALQRGLN